MSPDPSGTASGVPVVCGVAIPRDGPLGLASGVLGDPVGLDDTVLAELGSPDGSPPATATTAEPPTTSAPATPAAVSHFDADMAFSSLPMPVRAPHLGDCRGTP
jgi:hypothetical protein